MIVLICCECGKTIKFGEVYVCAGDNFCHAECLEFGINTELEYGEAN